MIITLRENDLKVAAAAHFKQITKLDVDVSNIVIEDNTAIIEYDEEVATPKPVQRRKKQAKAAVKPAAKQAEVAEEKPTQIDAFADTEEVLDQATSATKPTPSVFD